MRAALYVRLSDDRDGGGLAVARQEADSRALAERLGWDVTEVYVENDTSAYRRRKVPLPDGTVALRVIRPAFRKMLDDLASGHVDALICYDLDRIARDPRDLEDLIDVVETHQRPTKSVTGSLDLGNDAGITMARVMVAVANKSSRDSSRRIKRKYVEIAEAGKVGNGGLRPFGYSPDRLTIVPDEAAVLREAYTQVHRGVGLRTILAAFHAAGVVTTTGRPWSQQGLRYNLRSPRNAGLRAHKGVIVGPAVWPGIVPAELWHDVQAILDAPGRQSGGHDGGRRYALTGFLYCGLCGGPLKSHRNADAQRFACVKDPGNTSCGRILVRYAPLEAHVFALVLARIERDADLQPDAPADPTDDLRARIAAEEAALDHLVAVYEGDGDALELRRAGQVHRARIADLRGQIRQAVTVARVADPVQVRAEWDGYDLAQRRTVVSLLVEGIDVAPAVRGRNRFDAGRLTVRWR